MDVTALNLGLTTKPATPRLDAAESNITTLLGVTASLTSQLTALTTRVAALEARLPARGQTTAALSALGLGSTQDVTVTLDRAMANTAYTPEVSLSATSTVLGNVLWAVKSMTKTAVVVTVKNAALLTGSPSVTVYVVAHP